MLRGKKYINFDETVLSGTTSRAGKEEARSLEGVNAEITNLSMLAAITCVGSIVFQYMQGNNT